MQASWNDSCDSSYHGSSKKFENFIAFIVSHSFYDELCASDTRNTYIIKGFEDDDDETDIKIQKNVKHQIKTALHVMLTLSAAFKIGVHYLQVCTKEKKDMHEV